MTMDMAMACSSSPPPLFFLGDGRRTRVRVSVRVRTRFRVGVISSSGEKEKEKGSGVESVLLRRLGLSLAGRELLSCPEEGRQAKVLVAVSGGQDSTALLYLLTRLRHEWGFGLGVAHCDHRWTPCTSRQQASHVSHLAAALGLDYFQTVAVAQAATLGETAARKWRYDTLHRIALAHGYSTVATAHTASDRTETALLNLLRGSGSRGLHSLPWKRPISSNPDSVSVSLIRPLLDTTRAELRHLCVTLQLPIWPDPTNASLHISRNRVRHELLPYLERNFNPAVADSLARWDEIQLGEQELLDRLGEPIRLRAQSQCVVLGSGKSGAKLDLGELKSVHVALQRRILKRFIEDYGGRGVGFDHVEQIRLLCLVPQEKGGSRNGLKMSLPGGVDLCFDLSKGTLFLSGK